MPPAVVFDGVWKKFHRGERQDSLRDLVPSLFRRALSPTQPGDLTTSEFWALRDVSFNVAPGDALGIIGPNGAGKSTTLKLLTRILRPTKGRCEVRGRTGALIEIAAGFHPDLTGRENVYLQGAIMGMRRAEIARKFDDIVDFSGLSDFIDTPVKRYSSGMNARLGFAIAAHVDPDVLLIDEVLAVGDLSFQQRCLQRLAEFRQRGIAIVFVSHNLQAVASLCDRAMLLRPAQPPLVGPVSEVTNAYVSAGAAHHDPRVTVRSARLVDRALCRRVTDPVDALTTLQLELDFDANTDLPRCGLQLIVLRSDGTRMFDGISSTDGLASVDISEGQRATASIRFRTNLLRGTYTIGVNLVDEWRRWPHVVLPGLASFAVHETTRWGGCAELEPEYCLDTCRTESVDARLEPAVGVRN